MKKYILLVLMSVSLLHAKNSREQLGDILQLAVPLYAYGLTVAKEDHEGSIQLCKAYTATISMTYVLKYSIDAKRPLTNALDSFPSGHTSSAFSGASFIHKRYGFKDAFLPYLVASFTAYSRVQAKRHHIRDVLAGAVLGSFVTWAFTSSEHEHIRLNSYMGASYKTIQVIFDL